MTNTYPANNPNSQSFESAITANKKEPVIGKTDNMNLPEAYHFVDIDTSTSILSLGNISLTYDQGLSVLGLLACGVFLIKYSYNSLGNFFKKSSLTIADDTILFHDLALNNLETFAELAQHYDQEVFNQQKFLEFAQLKYSINNNLEQYQDLIQPLQKLQSALQGKLYYQQLENIVLNYPSKTLEDFSRSVSYLLSECLDKYTFQFLIEQQLITVLDSLENDTEKQPLINYVQAINCLIEDNYGLTNLRLLKQLNSEHFSVLIKISDIIANTGSLSMNEYPDLCQQLAQILALPERLITAKTFQIFGEYINLNYLYSSAFEQFTELIGILQKWYISYQIVIGIRQEYSPTHYQIPSEFQMTIQGLDLYQKYQQFVDNSIINCDDFYLDESLESVII